MTFSDILIWTLCAISICASIYNIRVGRRLNRSRDGYLNRIEELCHQNLTCVEG